MKLMAVLSLLAAGVASAAAPPKLTVIAGAGGYVRPGAIASVHVLLELGEDGEEYDGRVAGRFVSSMGTTPTAVRLVPLSPGAAKRTTLYLLVPADVREIEVWYESRTGRAIGKRLNERLIPLDGTKLLLGAVGAFPPSLPPGQQDGAPLFHQLNLQPDHIPDRHEGLEMFDALLMTPAPVLPLRSDQMETVKGWVMRGGTLVVDASRRTDFFRSSGLDELLPFIPQGTEQTTIEALGGDVLYGVGTPRNADVLLELEGIPLIYRRNYGLGAVVAFALDPQTAGLREWEGRTRLWQQIVADPRLTQVIQSDHFVMSPFATAQDGSAQLVEAVSQRVAPDAPSTGLRLGLVLILTALYALAVGPGDYFLIKRLGKPKLTWITFPAIVAVFTLAAYGGARWWIGGEMSVRSAHRIVAFPQLGRAIHYEAAGLFVPQGSTYAVTREGRGMLRHLGEVLTRDDRMLLDQDDNVLHHRIPIWTHRVYGASATVDTFPDVTLRVGGGAEGAEVHITNNTGQALQRLRLMADRATNHLNHLGPGESATLPLNKGSIRVHEPPDALSGFFPLDNRFPSMMREFRMQDAIERGAVILDCVMDTMPTALVVDGAPRSEVGPLRLQVLVYPEQPNDRPMEAEATP
jgi:hypothetical protein